jgi:transposase-like protein
MLSGASREAMSARCATTTQVIRAAIRRSQASIAELSRICGIDPKTLSKWRKRATVDTA